MKLEKRTYGDLVARAREKRGLGRADLAKRLGVSPSYVGFVEQGRRDPPPTALRARIVKELCLSEWDAASLEKLAVRDRCLTALARVRVKPRQPALSTKFCRGIPERIRKVCSF
ncbi:helix-turn-helix domain-containing protein [Achromobacter mucicolens]|uniref:helix-turn-helix domain-containing protein n=1 Tax=Achromobacter mucicolens TaxID=1389922 RepID=UPI003C7CE1D0